MNNFNYIKNNNKKVVILCFDIGDKHTFLNLKNKWKKELKECNVTCPILLIGNKCDLRLNKDNNPNDLVSEEEARKMANKLKAMNYLECSAKLKINVNNLFDIIIEEIVMKNLNTKSCCF